MKYNISFNSQDLYNKEWISLIYTDKTVNIILLPNNYYYDNNAGNINFEIFAYSDDFKKCDYEELASKFYMQTLGDEILPLAKKADRPFIAKINRNGAQVIRYYMGFLMIATEHLSLLPPDIQTAILMNLDILI